MSKLIELLKNSSNVKRDEILSKVNLSKPLYSTLSESGINHISPFLQNTATSDQKSYIKGDSFGNTNTASTSVIKVRAVNETTQNGEPAIYGPSSIYIPQAMNIDLSNCEEKVSDFEKFHNQDIVDLIANFFVWRYPDVTMFIHRESFLTDFYKSKDDIKMSVTYCSEELIYALCCLGSFDSRKSPGSDVNHLAEHFYHLSRSLIFEKLRTDSYPSLVMMQALLTLSLYDLGRGNNFSAWLLSGMAIRLGEHKGLSHEPSQWKSDSGTILSDYDIRVRSRVYWGCYLTEHFIANVLGRISILNSRQTTIRNTDDLPRLDGIDRFCYRDPLHKDYNIRIDVSRHLLLLDDMYQMCETFKPLIFSRNTTEEGDIMTSLKHLVNFTNKMLLWKETLPKNLQWNMKILELEGHNQVLMNVRNQYFLALLSFHRPFIGVTLPDSTLMDFSSNLCMGIISELDISIRSFLKVHDIGKCSLVTVYNIILTIMITMSKLSDSLSFQPDFEVLNFFVNLLKEMSFSWGIAGKYYNSIMNTYTLLMKDFTQKRDGPTVDIPRQEFFAKQDLQSSEPSELFVDFDTDLLKNEEMSSIFQSILGEMPNFNEGGFVGFDLFADM